MMRLSFANPWSVLSLGKIIVCLALLYCTTPGRAQEMDVHRSWGLRLLDPQLTLKAEATLQFTDQPARACMRGKWKRVAVDANDSTDTTFFPLRDALAYKLERGVVTIVRAADCHRFLLLSATVSPNDIHGTYKAVSVGRSKQLGLFTLRPTQLAQPASVAVSTAPQPFKQPEPAGTTAADEHARHARHAPRRR